MQGPVSRSTLSIEQLRKILDRMEEKNYSVVKENIDLKGQITELKEQVIKRNNFIEGLRSDCKIAIMDLKYFH
jgi:phosphoribosylaminoimidazole-succinocarboxamide synthase